MLAHGRISPSCKLSSSRQFPHIGDPSLHARNCITIALGVVEENTIASVINTYNWKLYGKHGSLVFYLQEADRAYNGRSLVAL